MIHQTPILVRPIQEEDVPDYHRVLDAICRERRYLGALEAPPLDSTGKFVITNILLNHPQYVACVDGNFAGWCDAIPGSASAGQAHIGSLGMGVAREYRHQGIGTRLLRAVLDRCREKEFEKVQLSVYASNTAAIALYERFGFIEEGRRIRGRCVDGRYDDVVLMGLFLNE